MANLFIMKKSQSIFVRFLISYVLILVVPLFIGSIAYAKAIAVIERNALNSTTAMLEQSVSMLDSRLKELENMVQQISLHNNVNRILNSENNFYTYWSLSKDLSYYNATNNFIHTILIYLKNKDVLISPTFATDKAAFHYENNLRNSNMSYGQWYDMIWNHYHSGDYIFPQGESVGENGQRNVLYVRSLPIGSYGSIQGTVIAVMGENEFFKILQNVVQQKGWAAIYDEKGEVIVSIGEVQGRPDASEAKDIKSGGIKGSRASKDGFIISHVVSQKNGWVYTAGVPYRLVMAEVQGIKMAIFLILAAALLLGMLMALFLASRNSKPIRKLVETLRNSIGITNPAYNSFDFLQGSISELLRDHEELKAAVQKRLPLLRAAFLDRLLRGDFNNNHEIYTAMANVDIELRAKSYVVLLLRIKGCGIFDGTDVAEGLHMSKLIAVRMLELCFEGKLFTRDVREDVTAVLLAWEDEDAASIRGDLQARLTRCYTNMKENNRITAGFAVGSSYSSPTEIYRSYNEALACLEAEGYDGEEIIRWYSDSEKKKNYFYYPVLVENKLINLAKAGDQESIRLLIRELYAENCIKRHISSTMLAHFTAAVKATIVRAMAETGIEDDGFDCRIEDALLALGKAKNVKDALEKINGVYAGICDEMNKKKERHVSRLKDGILAYIDTMYSDQQLSLSLIAGQFNLTEIYLSRFFKEQTGENLSLYIEQKRMEKAKQLVSGSDLSINEIAQSVGYSSAHTFRRAYKRIYGVIPSTGRLKS